MIYIIVDENGLVINRIVAGSGWVNDIPNSTAVAETDVEYSIGGSYVNGVYTPPPEPEPVPVVINVVTARQARLALLNSGLLDQVEAAVTQAGTEAKIYWDYSTEIHRDSPFIASIGQSLGLTDTQIDDLFKQAVTL